MYQLNPLLEDRVFEVPDNSDQVAAKRLGYGTALAGFGGSKLLGRSYDDLMGTVTRYHNTDVANVDAIKKNGILAKFADDPRNITNQVLRDVPAEKKTGLTYLGKNSGVARSVGINRSVRGLDSFKTANKGDKKNPLKAAQAFGGKTLKVRFNLDDYDKLVKVANPELRGAKNAAEFFEALKKAGGWQMWQYQNKSWRDLSFAEKLQFKQAFGSLGALGTDVIKGNIGPEHIVGSDKYVKATDLKRWANYVKKHPGKFARGVGTATAGVGGLAAAGYLGKKWYDKKREISAKKKED